MCKEYDKDILPRIDLTGCVFNRLTVLAYAGARKTGLKNQCYWDCLCSCGGSCIVSTVNLRKQRVRSCGCLNREHMSEMGKKSATHGLRHTTEYSCWANMVSRATNPNNKDYPTYRGRGIHPDWKKSFSVFIEHIGRIPKHLEKPSIERIDNTIGYFPGNVKWAEVSTQPRNMSQNKLNKSGVTGVFRTEVPRAYWVATWMDEGSKHRKCFSVTKYGEQVAFQLACDFRKEKIKDLCDRGIIYPPSHGIPRNY